MFAKKTILLIVLILTILQPAAALSGDKITFTSIPEGLDLIVGESIDFNITLKNSGVYSDVCIQLRNIPDGITVAGNNDYKLIDQDKSVTYDLRISADGNIESGIYEFEIADSSNYDFRTWTIINLAILNVGDSPVYNIIEEEEDVGEETEDVIPEINEVDIEEESNSAEQEDDYSITEESSDSIMDTAVSLTYTELSIAAVVEAISITIINLTLVAVVGIVRKRKRESTDTTKDENATADDYVHEDNQENSPDGEYDNEDDAV